jgi:hypothetical protein
MEDLTDNVDNTEHSDLFAKDGDTDAGSYKLYKSPPPLRKAVKARTVKQLEERAKLNIALLFALRFQSAIKAGFKHKKTGATGAVIVLRHLLKYAVPNALFGGDICYPKVMLSNGKLRNIRSFTAKLSLKGLLKINWVNSSIGKNAEAPDRLYLSFYNETKDLVHCIEQPICQEDLKTVLQLPFYEKRNQYHLWIFEVTAGNANSGNTFYIKL